MTRKKRLSAILFALLVFIMAVFLIVYALAGYRRQEAKPQSEIELNKTGLIYVPGETESEELVSSTPGATWTAEWENPSSAWARGKDPESYVLLSAAGEKVEVRFLAPFAERLRIVCSDGVSKAACVCDCLKRIKTFKGYIELVPSGQDSSVNPQIGNQPFSLRGYYVWDSSLSDLVYDELVFEDYTLDQSLVPDLHRSVYRLTQEFIDSFRPFALAHENATDEIRAKANGLSAEISASMLTDDPQYDVSHPFLFGGGIPGLSNWWFPLLTEGLNTAKDADAAIMGKIFHDWLSVAGNSETEIIVSDYFFEGSIHNDVFECRQPYKE